MTNLSTLRRADATGLTGGEWCEVVVVHVALAVVNTNGVEHLLHTRHTKCGYRENLSLTTLEESSAVSGAQDADLCRERTKIRCSTAVDANTLVNNAATYNFLLKRTEGLLNLTCTVVEYTRCI